LQVSVPTPLGWDLSRNLETRLEQPAKTETGAIVSPRPAIVLGVVLLSLALLTWPDILKRFISLDWQLANMRPVAYGMCAILAACGVMFLSVRRWINTRYAETFPSNKHLTFVLITMLVSIAFTILAAEIILRVVDKPFKERWNFFLGRCDAVRSRLRMVAFSKSVRAPKDWWQRDSSVF
jgi:hypothetical protein